MKKFLLSLALLGAVIFGHAQMLLNEFYIDASTASTKQYFELYNSGSTPINLNCYTIVSATTDKNGGISFFNVIDLPDTTIGPKGYFTMGAGNQTSITSGTVTTTYNFNFNWNAGTAALAAKGASFKKYTPNGAGTNYAPPGGVDVTGIDFILSAATGNIKNIFFLFNAGNYVDGLITYGSNATATVPATFKFSTLAGLSISDPPGYTTNTCGSYSIDWSKVTTSEYVQAATGQSHGYYRGANGLCGTWNKIANQGTYTPGTKNPTGTITSNSGSITSSENILCSGTTVAFKVTAADLGTLPATVELYYDANNNNTIDANELPQGSIPVNGVSATKVYTFDITNKPSNQNVLLVYRASLGCISKVVPVTAATTGITTTQNTICGTQLGFTITGTKADSIYAAPVEASLYVADPNNPGSLPADTAGNQVGKMVVTALTTTDGSTYKASGVITIAAAGQNQPIMVVYKQNFSCFALAPVQALPVDGVLNTTQPYACGKTITYTITPAAPPAAISIYSLPIRVKIVEDVNFNGQLDEDTTNGQHILGSALVTSYTNGAATGTITLAPADEGKQILVAYQTPYACLNPNPVTPLNSGRVGVGGGFNCTPNANGKRTATYFVVAGDTDPDAYPIKLTLYEDLNTNGLLDANETTPLNTKTVATPPPAGQTGTAIELSNANSYILVKAEGKICTSLTSIPSACAVLPVHFASFTATRNKGNVNLKWETATEINNRGFNVQRNVRGEWKTIAFVFSQAANGNSSSLLSYEYKDANIERGVTQYRIQQVDLDDKASYSEIRSVMGLEQASSMMVFPNPSHDGKVNVLFSNPSVREVVVSDAAGRIIRQYQQVTGTNFTMEKLPAGFFAIKVIDRITGTIAVEKVIVK